MNKEYNYFIKIIKNVLHNEPLEYDETIDYNLIYELAKFHSLECFMYQGCINFDLGEISKKLKKDHDEAIFRVAFQEAEKENLLNVLDQNNIKHMPLKGAILKYLYPSIELRSMCDFDCLIDKYKRKYAKKLMSNLGYTVLSFKKGKDDHYIKKPFISIEMHVDLFDDYNIIYNYYKNVWNRLIKVDSTNCEYKFTDEDFYIFMLAHLAKHFAHGGTGVRGFIDIYLYLKKYTNLDFNYINKELDKMGLVKFNKGAIELSKVWFDGKESNELMDNFAENVLNNGTYGTITNSAIVTLNEKNTDEVEKNKSNYIIRRIFPTYKTMCGRNPILKKVQILLPWFYITRLFKGLFSYKGHKQEYDNVSKITKEDIDRVNKLHEELGVKNKI